MTSYYTCFMMCFNKNIIRNSGNVNGYNFVNCSNEGLLTPPFVVKCFTKNPCNCIGRIVKNTSI